MTVSDHLLVRLNRVQQLLREAYAAMYSEYMGCPWCTGHIGHNNHWHDEFCEVGFDYADTDTMPETKRP